MSVYTVDSIAPGTNIISSGHPIIVCNGWYGQVLNALDLKCFHFHYSNQSHLLSISGNGMSVGLSETVAFQGHPHKALLFMVLNLDNHMGKYSSFWPRYFSADSKRKDPDLFSDIYITCLISFRSTFINIKSKPLMFSVKPILWIVYMRLTLLHFKASDLFEQARTTVSAFAKIKCCLRLASLFSGHPNLLWYSVITETSTFRDGDCSVGWGLRWAVILSVTPISAHGLLLHWYVLLMCFLSTYLFTWWLQ